MVGCITVFLRQALLVFNISESSKRRLWGSLLVLKELYPGKEKWNNETLEAIKALVEEYCGDINLYHIKNEQRTPLRFLRAPLRSEEWSKLALRPASTPCWNWPSLTRAAGRADDAPPAGKPAASSFDGERDDVAEKSNPRPQARREVPGLYGLCAAISPPGAKPEKAGAVHPDIGVGHRRRGLRFLWRPGIYQRELSDQSNTASHYPHTAGWYATGDKAIA